MDVQRDFISTCQFRKCLIGDVLNGSELAYDPDIGMFERFYIVLFGAPINGLRIRIRRILPEISGNPATILDAGCGRGVFTYLIARKFPEAKIKGIDTDSEQLGKNEQIARKAKLKNICFEQQDVAALSFKNEFDIVLSVDNLEHIEDDQKALNCLAKAVKNGGKLILHVPAYERRWFFFKFRTNFDVPGHYRPGYKLDDISGKVKATDLHIIETYHTYGWLENVSNNISYFITRAEAKNKMIYALIFPFINFMAWLGRNTRPKKGAGVMIIAEKRGS